MILTLLWISATTLSLIWAQRQEGKLCTAKTRAQLLARCCLLKEGTGASLQNASTLACTRNVRVIYKEPIQLLHINI